MTKNKNHGSYFIKPLSQMGKTELIIQVLFNLIATYVFVSMAIDTASMWIYLIAIIFFIFLIISSVNLVKKATLKDGKPGPKKNT